MTNKTIHLNRADIPAHLRSAIPYSGRKWQICSATSVHIGNQQWSGGSRTTFRLINLASGKVIPIEDQRPFPANHFELGRREFPMRPDAALVEHTIFCGKDLGIRLHVHPDNITRFLPAPQALTTDEQVVLLATRSLKSGYAGQNRFQMVTSNSFGSHSSITASNWDAASASLKASGLLNRRGAITTSGRNAAETIKGINL